MIKLPIKFKLTLVIFLIIFISGAFSIYFVFTYTRDNFVENAKENLKSIVIEQAHESSQIFSHSQKIVQDVAELDEVVNYLSNTNNELQDSHILQHLNLLNIGNQYSSVYIIDASGRTMASTDPSFVDKNYGFRDYFKESMSGKPHIDVAIGVTSRQLGYYFSHPVRSASGTIVGVAVIKMKPIFVHKVLDESEVADADDLMLVDQFGIIIHSQKDDRAYKSLGTLTTHELNEIKDKRRFEGVDIEFLDYDEVYKVIGNLSGTRIIDLFDEADDEREIIVITPIENTPFTIVLEQEKDDFIEPAIDIARLLILFIVIAIVVAIVFIYIFAS